MTPDTATSLQMELPSVSPAQTLDGAALGDSLCSPSFDRATYKEECEKRWHGECLRDALANWKQWQEIHAELLEAMRSYKRNPGMVDMAGTWHADGSLTDFVWKMQSAWQPNKSRLDPFLDFCDHYQRVFLRRGLLIYCGMLLRSIEANAEVCQPEGAKNL